MLHPHNSEVAQDKARWIFVGQTHTRLRVVTPSSVATLRLNHNSFSTHLPTFNLIQYMSEDLDFIYHHPFASIERLVGSWTTRCDDAYFLLIYNRTLGQINEVASVFNICVVGSWLINKGFYRLSCLLKAPLAGRQMTQKWLTQPLVGQCYFLWQRLSSVIYCTKTPERKRGP